MTWIIMIFSVIVAAFLQMALPGFAWLGQARFPFLLGVLVYYSLSRGTGAMLIAAFLAGAFQDALSPIPLGYSGVCFALAGLVIGRFRRMVLLDSAVTPLFFGAAVGLCVPLVLYGLMARDGVVIWPVGRLFMKVLGTAALGTVCTLAAFIGIGRLDRLVGLVEVVEDFDGLE